MRDWTNLHILLPPYLANAYREIVIILGERVESDMFNNAMAFRVGDMPGRSRYVMKWIDWRRQECDALAKRLASPWPPPISTEEWINRTFSIQPARPSESA